jgi:hypothetical protein
VCVVWREKSTKARRNQFQAKRRAIRLAGGGRENCNFHFAFMFSLTLKGENIKLSMIKQKNAASSNWPNNLKVEKE